MALKALISSPLEAGTSILDAHRLPPYLTPALEYTSKLLAKNGLHITLVVARREYQLPGGAAGNDSSTIPATDNPATNLPTPPASPASPEIVPCGPSFATIKSLARSGTDPNPGSADKLNIKPPRRSKTISLTKKTSLASLFDGSLGSPRLRLWPLTPKTPSSGIPQTPRTPATPATPASSVTTASSNATTTCSAGGAPGAPHSSIRLIHTTPLSPRADRLLTTALARATRRFNLGASCPLIARDPASYGIPPDVTHRSILQNELLFCAEGLTLLSLDHLYTFKGALARHSVLSSEPGAEFRLEDAVDELRRCILSSSSSSSSAAAAAAAGGLRRGIPRSVLAGTYGWMGPVDEVALGDVTRMYCRAYGGAAGDTGVVDDDLCRTAAAATATATTLGCLGERVVRPLAPLVAPPPPPPPPPKSEMRVARPTAISSFSSSSSDSSSHPRLTPPLPAEDQRVSPRTWAVGGSNSPMADDDGVSGMLGTPRARGEKAVVPAQGQGVMGEAEDADSEKTPTAPEPEAEMKMEGQVQVQVQVQEELTPAVAPPGLVWKPEPSPRASPKASLPTLKLQTSFQAPKKPPPRRKTTPMPKHIAPKLRNADTEAAAAAAGPPQPRPRPRPRPAPHAIEDDIAIVLHADDDDDDDDDNVDNDKDEGDTTDFEDGDLTARPPPSAVVNSRPGGAFWQGGSIDQVLGDGQRGGSGTASSSSFRHHRRSSSLGLSSLGLSPQQQQHEGPMTPNGYEDISPITRGEWGFLMVSDPFKTKTAAVETF